MITEFLQHSFYIRIVLLLLVLSILFQIIIGVLYQRMLRDTNNMAVTDNKILKQCKLKFTNCFELNEGTINIPVFVDKFMNQIRFAGLSLSNMMHMSGQLMLLSVFAAGIGVCKSIIAGATLGELLPYYVVSLAGLYIYFSVSSLVDAKGKKNMVRTNLIDYLENHLAKHLLLIKEKEMQPFIRKENMDKDMENESLEKENMQTSFKGGEQDELEQLLREFLA